MHFAPRKSALNHGQGQGTITPGPDLEPEIRFLGHTRLARVDDDELGASCFGLADARGGGRPRNLGVVAPEQNGAGVIVVR
jgi:hypothetical protein